MQNFLPALFFIAIVLSPCVAAVWSLKPSAIRWPHRRSIVAASTTAGAPAGTDFFADMPGDPGPAHSRSRAVLLRCSRSSQLRHLHLHSTSDLTATALHSLRPAVEDPR